MTRHRTLGVLVRHGWREAQAAIAMAEGPRATVRLMASRFSDTPSAGRSGEGLAQATGLSVRDINQAVDWLEFHGYAHVDRALGGSPSYHFCVAVALTAQGRRAYEQQRLSPEGDAGRRPRHGAEAVQGALERLRLGNLAREKTFRGLCRRWGMSSDLEGRLARLEDREAIRELAVRYCYGVDGAQAQALAELFTADSLVDFGRFGVFCGRDAIVPFLSSLAGRLRSFAHVMHNHVIDELTPSAATARCYFQVTGLSRKGKQVQVVGYYTDALVKIEGRWRFTSRQATFLAFFTLPVELVHLGSEPAGPGAQIPT